MQEIAIEMVRDLMYPLLVSCKGCKSENLPANDASRQPGGQMHGSRYPVQSSVTTSQRLIYPDKHRRRSFTGSLKSG